MFKYKLTFSHVQSLRSLAAIRAEFLKIKAKLQAIGLHEYAYMAVNTASHKWCSLDEVLYGLIDAVNGGRSGFSLEVDVERSVTAYGEISAEERALCAWRQSVTRDPAFKVGLKRMIEGE